MSSNDPSDPLRPDDDINVYEQLDDIVDSKEIHELTELIASSDLLSDPAAMLTAIMKYSTDGINVVEMENNSSRRKLLFCNDRFVEMSGRSREELMAANDLTDLTKVIAGELAFG